MPSRYDATGPEATYDNGVLVNKFGIIVQKDLDDAETVLLKDAQTYYSDQTRQGIIKIGPPLLFEIHERFLGPLYDWAGKLRTVDISKGGVTFATVAYLKQTMDGYGELLEKTIPKAGDSPESIARNIAIIHNEFNAIHPFRDGNGRTIRLFVDLLLGTLGHQPMDWGGREEYLDACIAGLRGDNQPIETIVKRNLSAKTS